MTEHSPEHNPENHGHSPAHTHDHTTDHFTQEFWDERYGTADRIWSGNVNPHVAAVAAELSPATALDFGCGEGGDVIWLASRGWRATGVDVSTVALDRAAKAAAEAGPEVAERAGWQQADVATWDPAPDQYHFVSAHFMHFPQPVFDVMFRRLAAAVRPGGTLLVVGHHPSDAQTAMRRATENHPGFMFTAEELAAELDAQEWETIEATAPERQAVDPEGQSLTIHDAVLRAVKRR